MENKRMLKLIWIGSGILLLLIAIFLIIQILKLGVESELSRYLSESLFSTIKGIVVHGLIGLIYIFLIKNHHLRKNGLLVG
ncbi:hypothetical protein HYX00_00685 [Candidatus Woesearchaeota archaeon]|nr:hypothetical protein [Candidatus Woesearchaeota archaeon]